MFGLLTLINFNSRMINPGLEFEAIALQKKGHERDIDVIRFSPCLFWS